jgi:transposase
MGIRRMRCLSCGLEKDRDIIAVKNPLQRYQTDVGLQPITPENPPM